MFMYMYVCMWLKRRERERERERETCCYVLGVTEKKKRREDSGPPGVVLPEGHVVSLLVVDVGLPHQHAHQLHPHLASLPVLAVLG